MVAYILESCITPYARPCSKTGSRIQLHFRSTLRRDAPSIFLAPLGGLGGPSNALQPKLLKIRCVVGCRDTALQSWTSNSRISLSQLGESARTVVWCYTRVLHLHQTPNTRPFTDCVTPLSCRNKEFMTSHDLVVSVRQELCVIPYALSYWSENNACAISTTP